MNSNETIQYLIDEGKITKEDLADAEYNVLSEVKKRFIVSLHTAFCKLNHDTGECQWYEEEELLPDKGANMWEGRAHKRWTKLFNDFLRSANLVKFVPKSISEESTGSIKDCLLSK